MPQDSLRTILYAVNVKTGPYLPLCNRDVYRGMSHASFCTVFHAVSTTVSRPAYLADNPDTFIVAQPKTFYIFVIIKSCILIKSLLNYAHFVAVFEI